MIARIRTEERTFFLAEKYRKDEDEVSIATIILGISMLLEFYQVAQLLV